MSVFNRHQLPQPILMEPDRISILFNELGDRHTIHGW